MAKNYFKRYIWLIDLLNRRGPISTQQIKEAWLHSPLNPQCRELSDRTFLFSALFRDFSEKRPYSCVRG